MAKKKKKTTRRTATKKTARRAPTRKKARKKAGRKKTAKKAARRTTTTAAATKPAKITGARGKPRTKSEIFSIIAEHNDISRKQVAGVFNTLGDIISVDLKKGKAGAVNVGGLMKVLVPYKKAVPRRWGVNPFTKEEQWFKAKPARSVVKVRPLKALKDRV